VPCLHRLGIIANVGRSGASTAMRVWKRSEHKIGLSGYLVALANLKHPRLYTASTRRDALRLATIDRASTTDVFAPFLRSAE
jgi:hypothetical protein